METRYTKRIIEPERVSEREREKTKVSNYPKSGWWSTLVFLGIVHLADIIINASNAGTLLICIV